MKGPKQSILAIFAHPDDESYRAGGFLSLLAGKGVQVYVITATKGEAGLKEIDKGSTSSNHSSLRVGELRCACQALGIRASYVFDFPDGHLMEIDPEELIQKIWPVVQEIQPKMLLSFGPDGLSGHPDHIATGIAAEGIYQRYQKAGALYHLAVPASVANRLGMNQVRAVADSQITLAIDVSSVWEAKMKAIYCHASQLASSPILTYSEERMRQFLGVEHFVRSAGSDPEVDFVPLLLKEYIR